MRGMRSALALAALVAWAAPALAQGPIPGASAGRALYGQYCASCHGTGGKGDGPVAIALGFTPADLTRLSEQHGTPLPRDVIASFIDGRAEVAAHGPREMPVWGRRFVAESRGAPNPERTAAEAIERIIDFLVTLQPVEAAAR